MFDSARGWAGIIIEPVPVATRTSRRTRHGVCRASCWASPPPQDSRGRRSARNQASHHGSDPRGQPGDGVGQWWRRAASHSGNVEPHRPAPRIESVNQRLQGLEGRADPVAQQERRFGCQFSPPVAYRDRELEPDYREHAHRIRGRGPLDCKLFRGLPESRPSDKEVASAHRESATRMLEGSSRCGAEHGECLLYQAHA